MLRSTTRSWAANRAAAVDKLKDHSAARIAYGRAVEIDPASAEARNDFGVFLFRSDQADRSLE